MAVKDVMTVKEGETSNTVKHRDGRVYAEVSAKLTSDDVSKASAAVQKEVDKMDLPSGVDVSMGGVTKDIEESFKQLGLAMLAAIAIVYFCSCRYIWRCSCTIRNFILATIYNHRSSCCLTNLW